MLGIWIAYLYFGMIGAAMVPLPSFLMLAALGAFGDDDRILGKIEHKYFTVRLLWRDNRNRKCNQCGDHDIRTRDITLPTSNYYESAYAPCEVCGSTDFTFFYLDGTPAKKY